MDLNGSIWVKIGQDRSREVKIGPIPVLKIMLNPLDQMRNILLTSILIGDLKVEELIPFSV